jgi:hypothetical protein
MSVKETSIFCVGIAGLVPAMRSEAVGIRAAWINEERVKPESRESFIT